MSVTLDSIQILQLMTEDEDPAAVERLAKKIVERFPQKADMLLRKMSLEREFRDSFITVTSAHELTKTQKTLIEAIFQKKFTKKVEVTYLINEDLLGGVVIRRGETVIDNSLRSRVDQLAEHIKETKLTVGATNVRE